MFAQDRDLLALEPNLFRDVGWSGQRLVAGVGTVGGTTLTMTSQDVTLEAAGITNGHVVLVDGTPYEVIARLSATAATISRVRPGLDEPEIPPSPVTAKPVTIHTFAPQIAAVHSQILKLLGIDAAAVDTGPDTGQVKEADITNPDSFRAVEAMGALYHAYCIAAGPGTADLAGSLASTWINRARMWRDRYAEALRGTGAQIDLDGDGKPDATRRPGHTQFIRD
jgi:hypothetical protein